MRVGISLLTLVPGEVGGAETYARGLCARARRGRRARVPAFVPPAAPDAGDGLPEDARPRVPAGAVAPRSGRSRWRSPRCGPGRSRHRYDGLDARPLPAHGRRCRALDLAGRGHAARPPAPRPAAALLARRAALPRAARTRARRARAAAVIVPSQFVRERAVERLGLPPDRVHAIPHGSRPRALPPGRRGARAVPALPGPAAGRTRTTRGSSRRSRCCARSGRSCGSCSPAAGTRRRPVPEGVEVRGHVSGDELASLYRRAAASSSRASTRASASRRSRRWPAAARSPRRTRPRSRRRAATRRRSSTRTTRRTSRPSSSAVLESPGPVRRSRARARRALHLGRRPPAGTRRSTARSV